MKLQSIVSMLIFLVSVVFLNIAEAQPTIYKDVMGIGIAGSKDHVYVWFRSRNVSSGTSDHLDQYRRPYTYSLPRGKTPNDIVGIGIAGSNDHVYVWFKDGTVSSGTSNDLDKYRKPYRYYLPYPY